MKDNVYQIKPASVMIFWVMLTLFIYPAVIFAVGAVSFPIIVFVDNFDGNSIARVIAVTVVPIWGAVAGMVIGRMQRYVLREKLYWAADTWVKWTVIGSALGASVAVLISGLDVAPPVAPGESEWMGYPFVIYLTILGAGQMVSLRNAVKRSWWWIIAHLVSGVVFVGVTFNNIPDFANQASYTLSMMFMPILAAVAQATITGFILLHLFEKHLHEMEPENADELPDENPPSIWDKAI